MIPLISSGFADKLCKATDVYQRIHTTLMGRVGGTRGERERREKIEGRRGGKEKRDGAMKEGRTSGRGGGGDVGLKLSEATPSSETEWKRKRSKPQGINL